MIEPEISVILPVYNAENYLRKAVESVLGQTFRNFELLIINDGSTDSSLSIAKEYREQDDRVVLISQKNVGLVTTLNRGISIARGKYIARMDADDISIKERFSKQVELLNNGYDICGCNFNIISENDEIIGVKKVPTDNFALVLMTNVPFAHGSVMIRKEFLVKNNLAYGQTKYIAAEDYSLWCSIYEAGGAFGNVDEQLFEYRIVGGSLSSNKKNMYHASMISYEFMRKNESVLTSFILSLSNENRETYKLSILHFSLLTFFNHTRQKVALFVSLEGRYSALLWLLKIFYIRLKNRVLNVTAS